MEESPAHALLRSQIRRPIRITNVARRHFRPGIAAQDEIVTTNRLILVLHGRLNYRMENESFRFEAGTQFFVPAWIRRVSRVPSKERCEAIWCEFDIEGAELSPHIAFQRKVPSALAGLEKAAYRRLLVIWGSHHVSEEDDLSALLMEGELKAMLARFWADASPPCRKKPASSVPLHPKVKEALRWLADHFAEQDALKSLYGAITVSPNYLRTHFQAAMSCNPGEYLQRLRLRQARYLIHETRLPQKQIAAMVGYEDPLYFSRLYHRFWGKAPGAERRSGK